jgi:N-acyl-D-amino-acid deacylase
MKIRLFHLGPILFSLLLTPFPALLQTQPKPDFEVIIRGGRVVDGSGNPWFVADLGVRNGRIAEIGRIAAERGARVIDARGLAVAPGFIDVHGHVESGILEIPTADSFLRMGVTSVITGNCGGSALPLGEWFTRLEQAGVSINVGALAGHNTIRRAGMNGDFDRVPTGEELRRMVELTEQAMREGAVGLSTGLIYIPGTYAKTDEIVELAKVAGRHGGVYATHMRNEGERVDQAIKEAIEIGELAGCPVEISHFKVASKKRWGDSALTVRLVSDARARGVPVTVDQYLYTASSTNIGTLFPSWIFDGGREKLAERLSDPATRGRIRREMIESLRRAGRADYSYAYVANHSANTSFNGKSIPEITELVRQKDGVEEQAEQAIEILLAGGAQMIYHTMSEGDLEHIYRQPFTMVASDSGVVRIEGETVPHPRGMGNNARALAVYAREKKLVSLEEAVRKMTSLPAQTFKLWDRGLLRPGLAADIVIFDEQKIADRATFALPKQHPAGIEYVLVNGQVVIERDKHTGARPGQMLRGPGARQEAVTTH